MACDRSEHKGYTALAKDFYYQRLQLGDGTPYQPDSCFVDYSVIYFQYDDPSIKYKMPVKFAQFEGLLHADSILKNIKKGAQLNFIVKGNASFAQKLCKDDQLVDSLCYQIELHIDEVYNLFEQEEDPNVIEYKNIKNFLLHHSSSKAFRFRNGIWIQMISQADSSMTIEGEIVLDYKGYSLDYNDLDIPDYPLKFNTQDQYQVIQGIEIALNAMHFGDSTRVIIPSYLAFGELGSKSGNVPPYEALIYHLKAKPASELP